MQRGFLKFNKTLYRKIGLGFDKAFRFIYRWTKPLVFGVYGLVLFMILLRLSFAGDSLLDDYPFSTSVYDRNGTLLRMTLSSDEKYRLYTPLSHISRELIEATLLYEDRFFYLHGGFNPVSIVRSFLDDYVLNRGRKKGASTITMQVARIVYGIHSQTILGKIVQILRAVELEILYSKKDILEAYLNLAPYGYNVEGVGAASLIYFKQRADKLSAVEAFSLSVIPQNPAVRRITTRKGLATITAERNVLFKNWMGYNSSALFQRSLFRLPISVSTVAQMPFGAPHFVEDLLSKNPFSHSIVTTIDGDKQRLLERLLKTYIGRKSHLGIRNGAGILLNWKTMEVEAEMGSVNFFDDSLQGQVNGAKAKRSPGSTLKPFLYALALEQGLIHPMTLLKDSPRDFGAYSPENFDRGFMGPIFAKDALVYSRNVPAVNLLLHLKKGTLYKLLKESGIEDLRSEDYYGLSLALGGVEVTMEDLAKLYAMLRNDGILRPLRKQLGVPAIERKMGNEKNGDGKRLLTPEASFVTLRMLGENPPVDEEPFLFQGDKKGDIFWKTGTSNAYRDAWSVAVAGTYVVVVWVGNFDNQFNPSLVGRTAAAPLMFEMIRALDRNYAVLDKDPLEVGNRNVKEIEVCARTGDLPSHFCKVNTKTWFIPGVSPIKVSDVYREVAIDKKTGLRACGYDPQKTTLKVYEFWPSDMRRVFEQSGFFLEKPPPYMPSCRIDQKNGRGSPPQVVLPLENVVYHLRIEDSSVKKIPFKAVVDEEVKRLYWFLDDEFIGETERNETLFWRGRSGRFKVRVVDDLGRSGVSNFSVDWVK